MPVAVIFSFIIEKIFIWTYYQNTETEREGKYIFSHVRKPGLREHPHFGERWDNKLPRNTDFSWVVCEILASWKQTRAAENKSITVCFLCGCVGLNIDMIASQKWSTGKKSALFLNKGRQGKKPTFVELSLSPEAFANGSMRIWTKIQLSFKPGFFPNKSKQCPNSNLLLGSCQASFSSSRVIIVSTELWTGLGERPVVPTCLAWRLCLQELNQTQ